jgi:hypothetical protein
MCSPTVNRTFDIDIKGESLEGTRIVRLLVPVIDRLPPQAKHSRIAEQEQSKVNAVLLTLRNTYFPFTQNKR